MKTIRFPERPIGYQYADGSIRRITWLARWWRTALAVPITPLLFWLIGVHPIAPAKASAADPRDARLASMSAKLTQLSRVEKIRADFGFSTPVAWAIDESTQANFKAEEWKVVGTAAEAETVVCELIKRESGGIPTLRGDSGKACGLTQLWESTARLYDDKIRCEQLLDPETHMRYFWRYWRDRLRARNGSVIMTALDWNRGSPHVDRDIKAGKDPDNGYLETTPKKARRGK